MGILTFMGQHPILTVILVLLVGEFMFLALNRIMRHINIYKHGYPTSHCNADGDIIRDDEEN